MNIRLLLTGGSGFVGSRLLERVDSPMNKVLGRQPPNNHSKCQFYQHAIDSDSSYSNALVGVDVIIHLAARVHIMNGDGVDTLNKYRAVNTYGTANLARQASKAGVKRFIFVSSIKVNGESTSNRRAFSPFDAHLPEDEYGVSKSEAEQQLYEIGRETGMEVVIIRPPLVYGPAVKANFSSLMTLVSKGMPLPFGSMTGNKRSLVFVDNLVDLIITCIDHPKAANQVFLASDDCDISTSEMVCEMAKALGKPTWQLPFPVCCYNIIGKLFNKSDIVDRLAGSLQVDIRHTKETLDWSPPYTLQEGFAQTARAFIQSKNNGKK